MENREKRKVFLLRTVSYILVAALASFATLLLMGRSVKLAQVEKTINSYFVGEVDKTAMTDAAASAMVASLGDPWSYYVSAEEYKAFNERKTNTYVGIGITIVGREDGIGFTIIQVEPDSSAANAGILPGDILIEVDGTSMEGVDSDVPVNLIRGDAGTQVHLVVLRQQERVGISVKRQVLPSVVAEGEMLPGNIGYVRINNFNNNCAKQTIEAIESLTQQGATALVFDVRNNGGGYVHEMNQVLDYLLPEGDLFRSVSYNGKEEVDTSDSRCLELPMAVLVNAYSYSCAEFFAAALREYDWATVVGEATVGKGYFQNVYRFADGSALGLSTGQYYTPNGVSLAQEGGLTPDVAVEVDELTFAMIYAKVLPLGEDPQLNAALEALE